MIQLTKMQNEIKIIKPAFSIYYFAPKRYLQDHAVAKETSDFLKAVWNSCSEIGISDKNEYLKLPTDFPALSTFETNFRPLAAKINRVAKETHNYDQQSFIFEHQDYFGLIASIDNSSVITDLTEWEKLFKEFGKVFPVPPAGNIAIDCYYLYTASLADGSIIFKTEKPDKIEDTDGPKRKNRSRSTRTVPSTIVQEVINALPPVSFNARRKNERSSPDVIQNDWCLWHKCFEERGNSLAILLPHSTATSDDKFFVWSIWVSETQIAPFTGYLLHLSKSNFAYRVFWQEFEHIKQEKAKSDDVLRSLNYLSENIVKYNINISIEDLIKVENELFYAQTESNRLLYSLSRLRDLNNTVKIALNNMEAYLSFAKISPNQVNKGFFDSNRYRVDRLIEQISVEINYLESFQQRISEGYNLTRLLQDLESKRNARRLNNLILWQGSLIGALAIGLTALQAFQFRPSINETVLLALSVFLGALALSLPPLFTHWEDGYNKKDYLIGSVLGGFSSILLITFLDTQFGWFPIPASLWTLHYFISFFAGAVAGWFIVSILSQLRKNLNKTSLGIPLNDDNFLIWVEHFSEQMEGFQKTFSIPPDFQSKVKHLLVSYSDNKTVLTKHALLNEIQKLCENPWFDNHRKDLLLNDSSTK